MAKISYESSCKGVYYLFSLLCVDCRLQCIYRSLPIRSIKRFNRDTVDIYVIKAPDIHGITIRVRTRDIERFDATGSAEIVYGGPRVELVFGKIILAL